MTIRSLFKTANLTLGTAVADAGTFTVSYPSGTSQLSFNAGLAGSSHYAILNSNDRWAAATPGIAVSFGASNITITNNTGYTWAAGTVVDLFFRLRKGNERIPLTIPLPPLSTITVADVITEIRPGIAGTIEYWEFVSTIAVTTAAKLATLNLEIDTTNVVGGDIALTSAALTPKGVVVGATPTGSNTLTRESKLSVEASAVTAFVEGEGFLVVYIRPTEESLLN